MQPALDDRVLKVADLLEHPGTSRPLHLTVACPDDFDLEALAMAHVVAPLRLDGVLESVVDGLLLRGTLSAPLSLECARCLQPLERSVQSDVVELFVDPATAETPDDVEQGYEIREGTLDLDTLLRDALAPAVPLQPLCRPDCAGLCPTCGADRNVTTCACSDQQLDSRWAALEGLRLLLPDDRASGDGAPGGTAGGKGYA